MKNNSVIYKCLQTILLRKATPDGKIERHELFSTISERIGHIPNEERSRVVKELKESGLIIAEDSQSYIINRS